MLNKFKTVRNELALADPIYNPEIEPKILKLYTMMAPTEENPEPPAVLEEYRQEFLALPTENVYSAVLVNPRQCDIDAVLDVLDDLDTLLPTIRDELPTGDQPTWDGWYPDIEADLGTLRDNIGEVQEHTNRLTFNLPTLSGIAQGAMGLATLLAALANPCAGLGDFFGSIMDAGKKLMADLMAAIGPLLAQVRDWANVAIGAIADMMSAITSAIAAATAAMAELMAMIASEIAKFAAALLSQIRMGLAEFMNAMNLDPCLAAIGGVALTSAAAAILG